MLSSCAPTVTVSIVPAIPVPMSLANVIVLASSPAIANVTLSVALAALIAPVTVRFALKRVSTENVIASAVAPVLPSVIAVAVKADPSNFAITVWLSVEPMLSASIAAFPAPPKTPPIVVVLSAAPAREAGDHNFESTAAWPAYLADLGSQTSSYQGLFYPDVVDSFHFSQPLNSLCRLQC